MLIGMLALYYLANAKYSFQYRVLAAFTTCSYAHKVLEHPPESFAFGLLKDGKGRIEVVGGWSLMQ